MKTWPIRSTERSFLYLEDGEGWGRGKASGSRLEMEAEVSWGKVSMS